MQVSAIHIYPVKSCAGISLKSAKVVDKGFAHDRYWLVTDPDGKFLTQREFPKMALIKTRIADGELTLTAPEHSPIHIQDDFIGEQKTVKVWSSKHIKAYDYGDNISEWLSDYLGTSARLVRMHDEYHRKLNAKFRLSDDNRVGFSDAYPFMIITQSSLDDLNNRLEKPLPMNRFRPNIVVDGAESFAEDTWEQIKIGDITFDIVKPCKRCAITTTNQDDATVAKEPLKTLATFRRKGNGVFFGQNMIHHNHGEIAVGDEIKVISLKG